MTFSDLIGAKWEQMDCLALVQECCRRTGFPVPPSHDEVARDSVAERAEAFQAHRHDYERIDDPRLGDIVLMWDVSKSEPDHIGFMLDRYRFIHSTNRAGVHIVRTDHPIWRQKIEGFYRCRS